jgi:hypothetical protein
MVRRAGSPTVLGEPGDAVLDAKTGDELELDMRATVERRMSYFDDDTDERYEAVDTHVATEGIVVSLAIGILLWAFIGLGAGWL